MNNRRTFLKQAALAPFLRSAEAAPSYGVELPDMLVSHIAGKINGLAAEWDRKRALIRTRAALEERNAFVRAKCIEMIHGLEQRTPLDPVIVRTHERDGYRVECLMFQSRPNFRVTASLYVPAGKGPFPGIISPCGHTAAGRLYPPYQCMYMGLVKEGFVVLAYDPIGQGERRHFWNPATDRNEIGGPVTWEHSLPGELLLLIGEDLTHYRIWDGMRAIDYLLTRPEVDRQRIGCCGQSGGGTLTLFISALDERVKCAAVHEGGTHHRWPVHIRPESWLGTGDTEQHFFPAAIYGADLCDLHVAIAPRPLLATVEHLNPGFQSTAGHVKARYELMGAADKFATVEAVDPHGMTMKLRLANTNWFCRWFLEREGPHTEPDFHLETAADMNCTPSGSIRYSGLGDTIYSIIQKNQAKLPPRDAASGAELQQSIRRLLRYHKAQHALDARKVATTYRRHYRIEKLEFVSEPGIYIPAWVFVPDQREGDRPAILYVNERGKEADGLEFGIQEELARRGHLVVAVDVRGIGETKPPHPDDGGLGTYRHVDDAETTLQYLAWEMNESLLGMRVGDVVRSVDYTLSRPDAGGRGVRAIGKGMGALWVMFAAALDTRIEAAVCEGGLLSYRTVTETDRYLHGADVFIRDVLLHFDLPQVAASIASRRLAVVAPVDAMKSPVNEERARTAYEFTARAYERAGSAAAFSVAAHQKEISPAETYLRCLEG